MKFIVFSQVIFFADEILSGKIFRKRPEVLK